MNDTNLTGSYNYDEFSHNSKELERLKRQAQIAGKLELSVMRRFGIKPGMNVLDLACGPGVTTLLLSELVEDGHVTGIDVNDTLLAEAEQVIESHEVNNIMLKKGDVYNHQLPENSFDFIYSRFLFQHLSDPLKALNNVIPLLKPGGIFCVLDVDDDWLTIHPQPEQFAQFVKLAGEGQKLKGGDRHIGRKLPDYFRRAGLDDIRAHVETITDKQIGMRNFLDITTGIKKEQFTLDERHHLESMLENIYAACDQPDTWGFVGVFCVSGRKID
jgi:ubiquinone/menaquinone biosynthesis C-methylase UbiE